MKRTLRNFCAALLACLTISAAPAAEKVVYLKDFLTPGAAETDAVPAVRAALEHCAATGARKLVLPGGRLCMRPEQAVEKYQFISNNDESLKRIAFDLAGMRDFEIDGGGTELLFTGFISPFSLEECENITIRDLTIDFTRTFNSEGIVEAAGDGWLEIRFPEDYLCDIVNGCLRFRDTEGTVYPFSNLLEFDAVRREPAFRATDYWLSNRTIPAEKCENGNIRILRKDLKATVGNVMVFGAAARYNPGFTLADCRGVVIRDVNLYHCGGMGVIAQRSRDIELRKLVIVPSPGKGRMISITADATHYVNCGGYIRMIDCVFENQKDDATNIHGLYMAVERVAGPDKLLLRWCNSGQYGVDFIVPGMRLELVDNDNVETYAHRSVKSVKRLNKVYTEVTFTELLPDGVKPLHVVAADDDYPEVLIKGCRMRGNRARGLLLGSRGRTVVEDNRFHIAGAAILIEGDANYWYEQSGVRDVVIRGNVFENGNYGSPGWGAACIAVGSGIPNRETSRYHRNIRVEGNTFRVFDPRIINLYCVDGFLFRRNKIEFTTDYPVVDGQAERFVTRNCDNVVIE
ncbi:right-handed parallel beta-helix repeat-containing protein [uncultured Alistipes sp.]|uniref:right-handed parallel beta-helix repeat-containing protein n=1 Tax=uncultured Alistipes sp. TaxID=538949 RepID=UPI002625D5E3|nr:right-handed parallel beta-helix repeat-containing protein [uncultured Alistipes sp.]